MFGNNDISDEIKRVSAKINNLREELTFVKEQQAKELEILKDVLEGLRYIYRSEKDGFSEIKNSIEMLGKPLPAVTASRATVETKVSTADCKAVPVRTSATTDETLTEKYNKVINNITSLKDMPEEFKSIGLKFDGNKLVPVSEIESYFIAKNKDNEYYLYPSVQVKSRRGQEATEGEFDYAVKGDSLITVKKPCRLLKFEYGYKVLEKGSVQID